LTPRLRAAWHRIGAFPGRGGRDFALRWLPTGWPARHPPVVQVNQTGIRILGRRALNDLEKVPRLTCLVCNNIRLSILIDPAGSS
jgi:hypothetical protein